MRAVPTVLVLLVLPAVLAPFAGANPPQDVAFNEKPTADVHGAVTALALDGTGKWGAVADAGSTLPPSNDLFVFNLQSQTQAWAASDDDPLNNGGKLVAVANGTSGGEGQWLVLVNNSLTPLLSVYQSNGVGLNGVQGKLTWQLAPNTGTINGVDITGDGRLIGVASGGAGQNRTVLLVKNNFANQPPKVLYRADPSVAPFTDVVSFTSIALATNATVPVVADSNRAAYYAVGASTLGTSGSGGRILVFETVFSPFVDTPTTNVVLRVDTSSPVTRVAITADGQYVVAGTDQGFVYLLTVQQALARQGVGNLQSDLPAWSTNLGAVSITALDIAKWGSGALFAAGTSAGDIALFQNQFDASGSEGSHAVQVGAANVDTPLCPTSLSGGVASLALSDFGDHLVVGAHDGLLSFEAGPFATYFPSGSAFEPAWCVGYGSGDVQNGVLVAISGDGKRVFAGTGHRAFGYNNFYHVTVDPGPNGLEKAAAPGERTQWAMTVTNDGSLFDRVNLSAGGPTDPGWQYSISNASLTLLPGRSQTILLNVTTPQGLAPGNFTITFTSAPERQLQECARSGQGSCQAQSLLLRLDVGQLRRVQIVPPQGILVATAGSPNTFPITLHNGGNSVDRFRISAAIPEPQQNFKSPGSDWTIRAEDPTDHDTVIQIPANSDGTMNLIVTPQAQRGDSATVEIDVQGDVPSPDGSVPSDTKDVTVAVEPAYNGDIQLAEQKEYTAWPGQLIFINYTVKNLGNSRDIFDVKNVTDPPLAPGWLLQLDDQRFELRTQNAVHTVRQEVLAQQGLQPGQSLKIVVNLYSEGLQKENPGVDGLVASKSVTVTVVPQPRRGLFGTPGPPEALVLVVVALGAVALRRRRGA